MKPVSIFYIIEWEHTDVQVNYGWGIAANDYFNYI